MSTVPFIRKFKIEGIEVSPHFILTIKTQLGRSRIKRMSALCYQGYSMMEWKFESRCFLFKCRRKIFIKCFSDMGEKCSGWHRKEESSQGSWRRKGMGWWWLTSQRNVISIIWRFIKESMLFFQVQRSKTWQRQREFMQLIKSIDYFPFHFFYAWTNNITKKEFDKKN